ncbi:Putative DEAD-box ATP-dependent RNA helicase 43 [Seminavis robusta]|uniref:RNA helicase n=1 Tax=Seminavis robusta TaxID=568900 RepID=A0A9N8EWT3_9STRA|nr:Putative DEAD-box ATP-dependent RNA helicase 43 [Seminavis robusta]|eukprot:Sro2072_g313460.1 Putative DEAD-box ATP-dependent RNA helicase 43 (655) ;mRNA; r:13457-15578
MEGEESLQDWKKRREARRRQRKAAPSEEELLLTSVEDDNNDDDDAKVEPEVIVPLSKRRRLEQEKLLKDSMNSGGNRRKQKVIDSLGGQNNNNNDNNTKKSSNSVRFAEETEEKNSKGEGGDKKDSDDAPSDTHVESLLERATALQQTLTDAERQEAKRKEEEERILRESSKVQTNALQAASELAKGVIYKDPMPSSWTAPRYILEQGEAAWQKTRKEWHMETEGNNIPPPMKRFTDMKLPAPIIKALAKKNIKRPTPIQMQGLPVALASRDMVGIAFTGSGKTMTFSLPMVMAALEEEFRMPLLPGEGPVSVVMAPSRELARQTYDVVQEFCTTISETPEYPELRAQLFIGGESVRDQLQMVQQKGVHCIVATPGRLRDILKRKAMTLNICRFICLDEADRMLDLGFDEEVGEIMNYFQHQRQTLLFSATFPQKFQQFAKQTLVQPIVVNVGRAGAANLDVIQEVEYVKQEAKIVYLLHCLQKTSPPGVEAVSIHGGKDQEERNEAIALYKDGKKDVLVATDIAAKGLDFSDIQHVINFDMPTEIENYVHRIGRTGRCGKTGVATTFINKSSDETTLLDLKHLLKEARQRIPPVLMMLDDPREQNGGEGGGCSFCGGLGHTIVDCPKIDKDAKRVASGHKDALATGGGYGGDW